jgi:serine/threonine protein phosphatase PrpC
MLNGRGYEQLTIKDTESNSNDDYVYSVSSMQGWRNEMEDAHCAHISLKGLDKWSFFAVFDGHGGTRCSEEASS